MMCRYIPAIGIGRMLCGMTLTASLCLGSGPVHATVASEKPNEEIPTSEPQDESSDEVERPKAEEDTVVSDTQSETDREESSELEGAQASDTTDSSPGVSSDESQDRGDKELGQPAAETLNRPEADLSRVGNNEEETLLIIYDEDDENSEFVIIDDGESSASIPTSYFEPSGRFRGEYRTRALWDIVHDGDAEDIFEWWQQLNLYSKYQFAEQWDAVTEVDTRYGVVGEAPQEIPFWGFNVSYSKWLSEVSLRQGYLRWREEGWDISLGSRIFVWGKNELFAAADFLNPVNAQGDIVGLLSDPRMAKEPIFAIDASYQLGDQVFQFVVAPIFVRSDVPIIGRDLALAPPGTELETQIRTAASVHPSIEDQIGDGLAGTEIPEESLWNSSIAFRTTSNLGGWDIGATIGWIWDRNPTIYLDEDLRGLLASGVNLLGANAGGNLSPEATAQLAAVQQKAALGQELFRATYSRQWVGALEAEGVLGPVVIRVDLGWKDGELVYTEQLESYRLMQFSGTLGLEYSYGESFFGQLSVFSQLALDAPGEPLLGWDDGELDPGSEGRLATLIGGGLVMRGSPEEEDWDWSTRTVLAVFPLSVANVLELGYTGLESQRLAVGTVLINGERGSLGDQFNRLNLVYGMYSVAF